MNIDDVEPECIMLKYIKPKYTKPEYTKSQQLITKSFIYDNTYKKHNVRSIKVLKNSIQIKLGRLSKFKESEELFMDIELVKDFDNDLNAFIIHDSKYDTMIVHAEEMILDESDFIKDHPLKHSYETSFTGIIDVKNNIDSLVIMVNALEYMIKVLNLVDTKLVKRMKKKVITVNKEIKKWDNVKTYDSYSSIKDIQVIEKTTVINREKGIFKYFVEHAMTDGFPKYGKQDSFIRLLGIVNQIDYEEWKNYTFDVYMPSTKWNKESKYISGIVVGDIYPIINMLQSMVIIEKHMKDGGEKDQLARAIYNIYNTHLFETDEITYIMERWVGNFDYNVRLLSSHELFKNPPQWLQNIIGVDGDVMEGKILVKKENQLKKDIEKEKQSIKKQFLKLNYGRRYNVKDPIQLQYFEKSFNNYLDGGYTRLTALNLTKLDELINGIKTL